MSRIVLNTKTVYINLIDLGITKKELADRMGIDRHTLNEYLKNPERIQLQAVSSMAKALGHRYPKDLLYEEAGD